MEDQKAIVFIFVPGSSWFLMYSVEVGCNEEEDRVSKFYYLPTHSLPFCICLHSSENFLAIVIIHLLLMIKLKNKLLCSVPFGHIWPCRLLLESGSFLHLEVLFSVLSFIFLVPFPSSFFSAYSKKLATMVLFYVYSLYPVSHQPYPLPLTITSMTYKSQGSISLLNYTLLFPGTAN